MARCQIDTPQANVSKPLDRPPAELTAEPKATEFTIRGGPKYQDGKLDHPKPTPSQAIGQLQVNPEFTVRGFQNTKMEN